jgi:hypothetical protein
MVLEMFTRATSPDLYVATQIRHLCAELKQSGDMQTSMQNGGDARVGEVVD